MRADVLDASIEFVLWETHERTAEPVADTQKWINSFDRAARNFQNAMLTGRSDASFYAKFLVCKHFEDARLSGKLDPIYSLSGVLTSFQSACFNALKELEPPHSTRGLLGDIGSLPFFKDGEQWALWIRRLTEIADENSLPSGVRKDAGNKSKSDKQSPFTLFVFELQKCLPKGCKYPTQSKSAPAKAIAKARRADVSLAQAFWKEKYRR